MSAPQLFRSDSLAPVRATRSTVHEIAVAFALEEFERKGAGPCMWLLGIGPRIVWIETPWDDDDEKVASMHFIRKTAQVLGADCYAFISEAWVATYDHPPTDDDQMPSELPKEKRDDILMIISSDHEEQVCTRFLVTVRRHGPNFLGPRVDETDNFEGRMFDVLRARA